SDAADAAQRFPIVPPERVDRDLKQLRRIVAGGPATVILCDNEGQVERLEELLGVDTATLVVGALDGGFLLPALRVLTDHELGRRGRRAADAAASSRRDELATPAGQGKGRDPADGPRAARSICAPAARTGIRVPRRHPMAVRVGVRLPL